MKFWMNIPSIRNKIKVLGQKGQTVVEFVLLLAVISSISYGFVSFINSNLVRNWEKYINLVITDDPQKTEHRIE